MQTNFVLLCFFLENLNFLSLKPLIAIALLFNLIFSNELQILPSCLCFHYFFMHSFLAYCTVGILKLWAQLASVSATCFTFSLIEGAQIPVTQIYPFCCSCSLSHHSLPEPSLHGKQSASPLLINFEFTGQCIHPSMIKFNWNWFLIQQLDKLERTFLHFLPFSTIVDANEVQLEECASW